MWTLNSKQRGRWDIFCKLPPTRFSWVEDCNWLSALSMLCLPKTPSPQSSVIGQIHPSVSYSLQERVVICTHQLNSFPIYLTCQKIFWSSLLSPPQIELSSKPQYLCNQCSRLSGFHCHALVRPASSSTFRQTSIRRILARIETDIWDSLVVLWNDRVGPGWDGWDVEIKPCFWGSGPSGSRIIAFLGRSHIPHICVIYFTLAYLFNIAIECASSYFSANSTDLR